MEKWLFSIDKIIPLLFGAVFIPLFEFFYGKGEVVIYTMTALAFFNVMDWISGTRSAKKDKTYASKYGIDGVFRSFFILMLPAGGHLMDMISGVHGVFFGILSFGVLYHLIQSMTANSIRAGWGKWVPEWLLVKLTDWVKEEIETKIARSSKRKRELEGE
ncbi:phage holin family protein [Psychrobacillus sp.]|uniref:phage holin family protein n=1 Tax=Psychrobacillus sp. TaxID=1871623 RepID=UPI0028BE8231|nr:phage holin family protein [Psychrobacillus sp.]